MANQTLPAGRKHRGFTLVELMIVVGIIGLLATVAIPQFQNMLLRVKKAERDAMITSLIRTVNDYTVAHGTLPGGGIPNLPQNPPQPADGSRQTFDKSVGQWDALGWQPDGLLYYRYDVVSPSPGVLLVTAKADLNQNGVLNIKTVTYKLKDGTWQWDSEVETPELF